MKTARRLRLATRGSALALAQTGQVIEVLKTRNPEYEFETVIVETRGDRMQKEAIKPGEATKDIFTKEIETALLDGRADAAVHSAKDLGVRLAEGLVLVGCPPRRDPRDVLVEKDKLHEDPSGWILTGSIRRTLQWSALYPQDHIEPIRGNIDSRIKKFLSHPHASGLILAKAGLLRLEPDLTGCRLRDLSCEEMLPAPGQGSLALECRMDDTVSRSLLDSICHMPSSLCLRAERAFLAAMDAGCQEPLGALATIVPGSMMEVRAVYFDQTEEGVYGKPLHAKVCGPASKPEELGQLLAVELFP
ncbi:MAG: hydroxymethylbilane synthase [Candidatus Methylacidiphilales bacterium]